MTNSELEELKRELSSLKDMVIDLQKENITLKGQATTETKSEVPVSHIELEKSGTPVRKSAVATSLNTGKVTTMEELTALLAEGVKRKAW